MKYTTGTNVSRGVETIEQKLKGVSAEIMNKYGATIKNDMKFVVASEVYSTDANPDSRQYKYDKDITARYALTKGRIRRYTTAIAKVDPTILTQDDFTNEECIKLLQRVATGMIRMHTNTNVAKMGRALYFKFYDPWIAEPLSVELEKRINNTIQKPEEEVVLNTLKGLFKNADSKTVALVTKAMCGVWFIPQNIERSLFQKLPPRPGRTEYPVSQQSIQAQPNKQ